MKSLLAIALIGILSFSTDKNEIKDIVLEEYEMNLVNLEYESELETIDLNNSGNYYLQNQTCDAIVNREKNTLNIIELQILNYEYLEELDSVEFDI